MKAGKRLFNSDSGELVEDGDPRATTLAYAADDDLSPEHEQQLAARRGEGGDQIETGDEPDGKQARPAANKARNQREDKGR